MKHLLIALFFTSALISCASHNSDRVPASNDDAQHGTTSDYYMMNR